MKQSHYFTFHVVSFTFLHIFYQMLKHQTTIFFKENVKLSGNNAIVSHFYVIMFTLKDEKNHVLCENDQILSPVFVLLCGSNALP